MEKVLPKDPDQKSVSIHKNGKNTPKAPLKKLRLKWPTIKLALTEWEQKMAALFSIIIKAVIGIAVVTLFVLIHRGFKDDTYALEPFSVPDQYAKNGLNGLVFARHILDEVAEIKKNGSTIKEDKQHVNTAQKPEMKVNMLGFGISLKATIYYIKEALGRSNRSIGGEVVQMEDHLRLLLRITGMPPQEFRQVIGPAGTDAALDTLVHEAAKFVLKCTDPYLLAVFHYHHQDYDAMMEVIHYMIMIDQEKEWAYSVWASLLRKQRRYEEAADKAEKSVKINPRHVAGWLNWGYALQSLGKKEEALEKFRKVLEITPRNASQRVNYAWRLHSAKLFDESQKQMQTALRMEPDNANLITSWGWLLWNQNRRAEAIEKFKEGYTQEPGNINTWMGYAMCLRAEGKTDESMDKLRDFLKFMPNSTDAAQTLANLLLQSGEHKEAMQYFHKVLALGGKNQTNLNSMAIAQYSVQQYDSAFFYVNQAIALDTLAPFPYSTLAETYALTKDDKQFYRYLEKAISLGFPIERYMEISPYDQYADKKRFQELVEKYQKKESPGTK